LKVVAVEDLQAVAEEITAMAPAIALLFFRRHRPNLLRLQAFLRHRH
jgi:hypothetical protein